MGLLPVSPSALFELGRAAAGQVVETAASIATVPVRVQGLVGQAELLVSRITMIADSADALVGRVATTVDEAQELIRDVRAVTTAAAEAIEEAGVVAGSASRVVTEAEAVTVEAGRTVGAAAAITESASAVVVKADTAATEATELLDGYGGTLRKAAPLAAQFVDELSPEEITAAIRMVDSFPSLQRHLSEDVLPLLAKLDQVGPDLHKLLAVTEDLHLAIAGLPGLRLLRRRGEERVEEDAANGR